MYRADGGMEEVATASIAKKNDFTASLGLGSKGPDDYRHTVIHSLIAYQAQGSLRMRAFNGFRV